MTKIILIGIGPHSQRIYLPAFKRYGATYGAQISLGLDLKEKQADIETYLSKSNMTLPMHYIDDFNLEDDMPGDVRKFLDSYVEKEGITGVVIATEPLVHWHYAEWALSQGLNILMDKPITTHTNVASDMLAADYIYEDYAKLLKLYNDLQKHKETAFSINVQRRYHVGNDKILELIREVAERFNAPVTSIQSMHADGQWRMPCEIVTQLYHPYCQGYGKCSHSGYHLFDIVSEYYKAGLRSGKAADAAEVMTSFVNPSGFLRQFNEADYHNYFGDQYEDVKQWSDEELSRMYPGYGEMDAFSIVRLMQEGDAICNISINLLHNSSARRTWMLPGSDLYKGNGRIKHEYHSIQQGPFQNIQVHSYQANDKHDVITDADDEVGGNNHFDIYVFRNAGMFDDNEKPFRLIQIKELNTNGRAAGRLAIERAKDLVVIEFLRYLNGEIGRKDLRSNIDNHELGVQIMSAIYRSNVQYETGESPIAKRTARMPH